MFYLKLTITFIVSYLVYRYMNFLQKREEEKAERVFQRTMKEIAERNKFHSTVKEINDFDEKNIYLKKGNEIIGLHTVGYKEIYEYNLCHLDGSIEKITTDFMELEKWGNIYDENFKMLGRGSFRIFDLTIEHTAKSFEEDGWIRFEKDIK